MRRRLGRHEARPYGAAASERPLGAGVEASSGRQVVRSGWTVLRWGDDSVPAGTGDRVLFRPGSFAPSGVDCSRR